MDKATHVDVRINFPYDRITIENIPRWQADGWKTYIRNGKSFTVERGNSVYQINPSLVTYMEISDHLPF